MSAVKPVIQEFRRTVADIFPCEIVSIIAPALIYSLIVNRVAVVGKIRIMYRILHCLQFCFYILVQSGIRLSRTGRRKIKRLVVIRPKGSFFFPEIHFQKDAPCRLRKLLQIDVIIYVKRYRICRTFPLIPFLQPLRYKASRIQPRQILRKLCLQKLQKPVRFPAALVPVFPLYLKAVHNPFRRVPGSLLPVINIDPPIFHSDLFIQLVDAVIFSIIDQGNLAGIHHLLRPKTFRDQAGRLVSQQACVNGIRKQRPVPALPHTQEPRLFLQLELKRPLVKRRSAVAPHMDPGFSLIQLVRCISSSSQPRVDSRLPLCFHLLIRRSALQV